MEAEIVATMAHCARELIPIMQMVTSGSRRQSTCGYYFDECQYS